MYDDDDGAEIKVTIKIDKNWNVGACACFLFVRRSAMGVKSTHRTISRKRSHPHTMLHARDENFRSKVFHIRARAHKHFACNCDVRLRYIFFLVGTNTTSNYHLATICLLLILCNVWKIFHAYFHSTVYRKKDG